MSVQKEIKKVTVPAILRFKERGEKISALTAYDYLMAEMLDECGLDIILIGDSVGMVVAGYNTTLSVSMDEMAYHSRIVRKAVKRALVVADMPFMSYQTSIEDGIRNAGRLMKEAEVEAVKIEGGKPVLELVHKLVNFGIPVMGHLGLTPQSINKFGSYSLQGKDQETAKGMIEEARLLQEAGAFSIVLEKIPEGLAKEITNSLKIPTIGIGAGIHCDGQILVSYDMLGIFDKFRPRFVRRYANMGEEMRNAFRSYSRDVKGNMFPSEDESFE